MTSLCCYYCQLPEKKDETPLIVDVNEVLSDEAWSSFKTTLGCFRRKCIRRSNYTIEVPESCFAFAQIGEVKFDPIDPFVPKWMGNIKTLSRSNLPKVEVNGEGLAAPGDGEEEIRRPDQAISLDTTFYNATSEGQTYQFKVSNVRTSRLEVTYLAGFTVADKGSFSIGLPKTLVPAALGLSTETRHEVKESRGHTFEQSMTMEASSDIRVAKNSKYIAKVLMEDRMVNLKFKFKVRMSMPQKRAPFCIRRKSDNASVHVFNVGNLEDIFISKEKPLPNVEKVEGGDGTQVDFTVEGIVKGNLACDHSINLTSDEIDTGTPTKENGKKQENKQTNKADE